jgi:hypothetical protein
MEQKINIQKFPCMHGNINFVWNKIKDEGKFPHVFHKQLYLHGIFPSIDRKKHGSIGEYNEHNSLKEREQKGCWFKSHLKHLLHPCAFECNLKRCKHAGDVQNLRSKF